MNNPKRPKSLTEYISARLTSNEERLLQERAEAAGLTKSEWCRQTILKALDTPVETQLILSELMALRAVVLAIQVDLSQGLKPTEQRIQAVMQHADTKKFAMAESRIRAFQSQEKPPNQEPAA